MCEPFKLENGIKLYSSQSVNACTIILKFKYSPENIYYICHTLHLLEHLLLAMFHDTLYIEKKCDGMTIYNFIILEIYTEKNTIEEIKNFISFIFRDDYLNTIFEDEIVSREANMINNELYQRYGMGHMRPNFVDSLLNLNMKHSYKIQDLKNHSKYIFGMRDFLEDVSVLFNGNTELLFYLIKKLKNIKLNKTHYDFEYDFNGYYMRSNTNFFYEIFYKLGKNTINDYLYFIKEQQHKYQIPLILEIGNSKFINLSSFNSTDVFNALKKNYCHCGESVTEYSVLNSYYLCFLMSINYNCEKLDKTLKKTPLNLDRKSAIIATSKFSMILNKPEDLVKTTKESVNILLNDYKKMELVTSNIVDKCNYVYFQNMYDSCNKNRLSFHLLFWARQENEPFNKVSYTQKNLTYPQLYILLMNEAMGKITISTTEEYITAEKSEKYDLFDIKPNQLITIYSQYSFLFVVESKKRYHGSKYDKEIRNKNHNKFRKLGLYGFMSFFSDHNVTGFCVLTSINIEETKNYIFKNFENCSVIESKIAPYFVVDKLIEKIPFKISKKLN